jgi:hypothetical protein
VRRTSKRETREREKKKSRRSWRKEDKQERDEREREFPDNMKREGQAREREKLFPGGRTSKEEREKHPSTIPTNSHHSVGSQIKRNINAERGGREAREIEGEFVWNEEDKQEREALFPLLLLSLSLSLAWKLSLSSFWMESCSVSEKALGESLAQLLEAKDCKSL